MQRAALLFRIHPLPPWILNFTTIPSSSWNNGSAVILELYSNRFLKSLLLSHINWISRILTAHQHFNFRSLDLKNRFFCPEQGSDRKLDQFEHSNFYKILSKWKIYWAGTLRFATYISNHKFHLDIEHFRKMLISSIMGKYFHITRPCTTTMKEEWAITTWTIARTTHFREALNTVLKKDEGCH